MTTTRMVLQTFIHTDLVLPKGRKESEQEVVHHFFEPKVPAALKERRVLDSSFVPQSCSAIDCFRYARELTRKCFSSVIKDAAAIRSCVLFVTV